MREIQGKSKMGLILLKHDYCPLYLLLLSQSLIRVKAALSKWEVNKYSYFPPSIPPLYL